MASGGGYFQGYGRGGRPGGGGYGEFSSYAPRGQDYSRDPDPSFGAESTRLNPDFYHKERGYGYEGTKASAIDPFESPMAKRRKIDSVTICVDYVRGFCVKGSRCPKPHVDYVESIDEREVMAKLKFCHDFQNRGMCTRRDCKFLHVTRREEDEFLLTGTIPQAVFVRMREWTAEHDPNYNAFQANNGGSGGGGNTHFPPRNPTGRSFNSGRGQMGSRQFSSPNRYAQGGRGSSFGGYISGTGHSVSQPVTYGNYCVDFLKGTCSKSQDCSLAHAECVDDIDDRQGIIKQVFCHDYQNQNCKRPFCKFVHASRQEEDFFMENGFFSPTLNARNRDKMFYSSICIDHLRNQCVRGNQCQYKHVDKVEAHNERICLSRSIFCHDYQEGGCGRPACKLVHTGKPDEQHFLRTGTLPAYLKLGPTPSSVNGRIVCREFVKNQCSRGSGCRFYHPLPDELPGVLSQQKPAETQGVGSGGGSGASGGAGSSTSGEGGYGQPENLSGENEELKGRVQQLERLLADACHCITLAVGDQNPAIAALMKTIANMAPASSLANQTEAEGGGEEQSDAAKGAPPGSMIPQAKLE